MQKKSYAPVYLIILGTILYFIANLQRVSIPGAIFDILQNDLKTTAQSIAALGSIYMYSYALGQLLIGVLVARFGGFRVVKTGAIIFFIGNLIFPCSHSIILLYISRFLIGLGSATFYLGMINETRNIAQKKNFGIILSFILFTGYLGGIIANAPLVICIDELGWRNVFLITGILCTVISLIYCIINKNIKPPIPDKSVHFDLELFKQTFSNKKNIYLYSFACVNYGLYYVIQSVIGKKFLEDFCLMSSIKAAGILSIMAFLYAIAGPIIASVSRLYFNKRTIFLKLSAYNTIIVFGIILLCVSKNVNTLLIPTGFCLISFGASLSPILIPLLHDYNDRKTSNTAVSILPCGFYLIVGILAGFVGFCLDHFLTLQNAYNTIFLIMFILSIFSFINVYKIQESKTTLRLIEHLHYIQEHHNENNEFTSQ